MVVYADVLVFLNFIVDYFLLKISSKILKVNPKLHFMLLSSLLGAVFSLYIFFPKSHVIIEFFIRFAMSAIMVLVCFGFKNFKFFLKSAGVFFGVTCLYAGVMIALWQILKPAGMVINNSVVYFNISPLVLIGSAVIGYIIYAICINFFAADSKVAQRCEILIFAESRKVSATAIIDTGNSLVDAFQNSEIIIADKAVVTAVFGNIDITQNEVLKQRYRAIPCATVSGMDILDGFRCDKVQISLQNKKLILKKVIIAVSKTPLKEDYSVILNPKILDNECNIGEEKNETKKSFV